jgi:non-ribosomal peptide synthetase component F
MTIEEFISQVHGIVTQAKSHQALPFERLVDVLKIERDALRHPIFQVMFAIDSFDTSYQSNNDRSTEVFTKKPINDCVCA